MNVNLFSNKCLPLTWSHNGCVGPLEIPHTHTANDEQTRENTEFIPFLSIRDITTTFYIDFYKVGHYQMYPDDVVQVFSNWTARYTHVKVFRLEYHPWL